MLEEIEFDTKEGMVNSTTLPHPVGSTECGPARRRALEDGTAAARLFRVPREGRNTEPVEGRPHRRAVRGAEGAWGRLLVIEDDHDSREMLGAAARRLGIDAVLVADGGEAIEILSTESFDVVLLDLMLHRVSGLDVLAYYGGRYPGRRNVIVASGAGPAALRNIDRREVYAVLAKPFRLDVLASLVAECAARR